MAEAGKTGVCAFFCKAALTVESGFEWMCFYTANGEGKVTVEKLHVLLVEDNPDDEFLALRALRRQGLENVVVAHDGEEALSHLLGTGCPSGEMATMAPGVILLDLKLPKINGIEVLKTLRNDKRTERVPVIVLSSSREECDLKSCRELGALAYLTKPVDGKEIVGILEQAGLLNAPCR